MNRPGLLTSIGLTAIMAASCSGSSKKLDLGGQCVHNSDCNDPLSCQFATCHQQCVVSRDCPTGQQCVAAVDGSGVCQTPTEAACSAANPVCGGALVCYANSTCVNACTSAKKCPLTSQTCVNNAYCLGPELANSDAGAAGAGGGVDAGVDGAAGIGGSTGPTGGSGGSDAGVDVPITTLRDGAIGSGGAGSGGQLDAGTGSFGHDSGTAGASGNLCTPGQAPTNFGNVANGDPNPNYTSGVGLLTATEFLTFSGYVGPASTDGGVADDAAAASVNRIDAQHFDPITGNTKGSATPLLTAGGDGGGLRINGADIAPSGEIAIIYGVHATNGWGMFLTFLDKDLAPKKTTQFVAWGSAFKSLSAHVKWLNGEFVASSMFQPDSGKSTINIKLGKFGADGSNAGSTNAIPTDDPSNGAFDDCLGGYGATGEGEVAFSGGRFAVGYFSAAQTGDPPYLTIVDALGAGIGSPVSLQSTKPSSQFVAVAGTLNGFVTVYNGRTSSDAWALLATYVPNSTSGDAGVVPLGATYTFLGRDVNTTCPIGQTSGSTDGTGAGFAILYPSGVSFLYFGEDGSPRGQEQTVLYEAKVTGGEEVQVTNFGGTFTVSLYSDGEHLTRVVASTCQ
jgi:hypothetical protein